MQNLLTLYVSNSTVLELVDLAEAISGEVQTTATVTVTLKDSAGASVTGASWPVTMTHVGASPGTYRALLDAAIEVTAGERYVAGIHAEAGGVVAHWEAPVVAKMRQG